MPRKTNPAETTVAGPGHNSLDRDQLRSLLERIESIQSERAELGLRYPRCPRRGQVHRRGRRSGSSSAWRKQDRTGRAEQQAVIDVYLAALGDYGTTEVGRAAIARASGGMMPPV